jgi:hypothetical protein
MHADARLQTDAPGVEQRPKGGSSARQGSTKVAHHAAGTLSSKQRSAVGNDLPSGGLVAHACARLAARQGLGQHREKQGRRNGAAKMPNAGVASRVRARGRVCAWVHACAGSETRQRAKAQRHTAPERKGKDSGSKQGRARVEEGNGTCKATGSARWWHTSDDVCAAARSKQPQVQLGLSGLARFSPMARLSAHRAG